MRFRTIREFAGTVPGPTCNGCRAKVDPVVQFNAGPAGTRLVLQFPAGWVPILPIDGEREFSLSEMVCPNCARKVDRGEEFERD